MFFQLTLPDFIKSFYLVSHVRNDLLSCCCNFIPLNARTIAQVYAVVDKAQLVDLSIRLTYCSDYTSVYWSIITMNQIAPGHS